MATKNIEIQYFNGSSYDILYPTPNYNTFNISNYIKTYNSYYTGTGSGVTISTTIPGKVNKLLVTQYSEFQSSLGVIFPFANTLVILGENYNGPNPVYLSQTSLNIGLNLTFYKNENTVTLNGWRNSNIGSVSNDSYNIVRGFNVAERKYQFDCLYF